MIPVENILKDKGVPCRVIALGQAAVSVDDVVRISGGTVVRDEICKTIVVCGKKSHACYGVVLQGDNRVDFKKVGAIVGESVEAASREEVTLASGVTPGAVCPWLLRVPFIVDAKVAHLAKINTGSGDHEYGIEFPPSYLVTHAFAVGDIVR